MLDHRLMDAQRRTTSSGGDGTFAWQAHPLRDHPRKAALAVMAILAVGLLVALTFREPTNGVLGAGGAMLFLLLTLNRFFFPSRFILDPDGISAAYPLSRKRLAWADIRAFGHDTAGGHLSTRAGSSRWAGFGGMPLLLGRDPARVIAEIEARMPDLTA